MSETENLEVSLQFGKGLVDAAGRWAAVSCDRWAQSSAGLSFAWMFLFVEIRLGAISWCVRISQTRPLGKSLRARDSFLRCICLLDWKAAMTYFSLNLVYHPGLGVMFPIPLNRLGFQGSIIVSCPWFYRRGSWEPERLENCPRENGILPGTLAPGFLMSFLPSMVINCQVLTLRINYWWKYKRLFQRMCLPAVHLTEYFHYTPQPLESAGHRADASSFLLNKFNFT